MRKISAWRSERQVRDIVHVVPWPCSSPASKNLLEMLENYDREQWYFSMIVERPDVDSQINLAQAARRLGVPVMTTRIPRGERIGDWRRTLLDHLFHLRNSYPDLVHVHWGCARRKWGPASILQYVMLGCPILHSSYADSDDSSRYSKVDWGATSRKYRSVLDGATNQ